MNLQPCVEYAIVVFRRNKEFLMCVKILVRLFECGCIGTAGPIGCTPTDFHKSPQKATMTAPSKHRFYCMHTYEPTIRYPPSLSRPWRWKCHTVYKASRPVTEFDWTPEKIKDTRENWRPGRQAKAKWVPSCTFAYGRYLSTTALLVGTPASTVLCPQYLASNPILLLVTF